MPVSFADSVVRSWICWHDEQTSFKTRVRADRKGKNPNSRTLAHSSILSLLDDAAPSTLKAQKQFAQVPYILSLVTVTELWICERKAAGCFFSFFLLIVIRERHCVLFISVVTVLCLSKVPRVCTELGESALSFSFCTTQVQLQQVFKWAQHVPVDRF